MGINPILMLSKTVAEIDAAQLLIADTESQLDRAILVENNEQGIAELRLELTRLKAFLGQLRTQEAFWRQDLAENTNARKAQGDIARA